MQNLLFLAFFSILLLGSVRKIKEHRFFDPTLTDEIKGFAILAVIFGHIGYFLVDDHTFLYPLSIASGVGVNIFLFLSGLGLTFSQLKNPLTVAEFYRKRFKRLFIPMWLVLGLILTIDYLLLGKTYPLQSILHSFIGWFPSADLQQDIDSPLWYFTYILFYYLIFPWVWVKKFPYLSVGIITALCIIFVEQSLPIHHDLLNFYKLHFLAFPLGMFTALISREKFWPQLQGLYAKTNYPFLILCLVIFAYTAVYSGVGGSKLTEQLISLVCMASIVSFFLLKKFQFEFLKLMGIYSYEIYLIHWPILSRHDVIYKFLPVSAATGLYLAVFLVLGFLLQKVVTKIEG